MKQKKKIAGEKSVMGLPSDRRTKQNKTKFFFKNTSQYKDMTDSSESSSKQNNAYIHSQLLKLAYENFFLKTPHSIKI